MYHESYTEETYHTLRSKDHRGKKIERERTASVYYEIDGSGKGVYSDLMPF